MNICYFVWFRVLFFVVVESPLIEHDDGILGDKVTLVPIVLDDIVVHSQLGGRPPPHRFLQSATNSDGNTLTSAQIQ
jgi:hypothetical protein